MISLWGAVRAHAPGPQPASAVHIQLAEDIAAVLFHGSHLMTSLSAII